MKMKRKISLVLAIVFILGISISAMAGVQQWIAAKPGYDVLINNNPVSGNELMNIDGNTYVRMNLLGQYGITSVWDEANRIARFNIPQLPAIEEPAETISILDNQKASVRFYNAQNAFIGNGVWISDELILTTKTIWGAAKTIKEYDNNTLTVFSTPVKTSPRLVVIKAKTTSNYFVTPADETPVKGDTSVLVGSIAQTPNVVNFSTVHDYEDFNLFDSGNKEYLRTNNDVHVTSIGSGIYNANGYLTGIMFAKGGTYCICVKLADIKSIID